MEMPRLRQTFAVVLVLLVALTACSGRRDRERASPTTALSDSAQVHDGRQLAARHCSRCHLLPEPGLLDKTSWGRHVLPEMAWYLGLYQDPLRGYVPMPAHVYRELQYMGTVPPAPVASVEEYRKIIDYYTNLAPDSPSPGRVTRLPAMPRLAQFEVTKGNPEFPVPGVTLVKTTGGGFFLANASDSSFAHKNAGATTLRRTQLAGYPVHLSEAADGLLVTMMGSFTPLDDSTRSVWQLRQRGGTYQAQWVLTGLKRPVFSEVADLDADGRPDLLVCEFGSNLGGLSWFRSQGDGTYQKRGITPLPGAIRTEIRDFDGNGLPDVAVLMGQAREGIYLYYNRGDGQFSEKTLLSFPPTYGSTDFRLVDMDGDGHEDIVYANGDHADYPENPPRLRPYHGIRVYRYAGKDRYEEAYHWPMNGVYRLAAADFDGDGDADLAAVAHFADYYQQPQEGFVYLRNEGGTKFAPLYLEESKAGRWLTLDAGDLDGDGDPDLVLGAALSGIDTAPPAVQAHWERQNLSYLVLKNRLK